MNWLLILGAVVVLVFAWLAWRMLADAPAEAPRSAMRSGVTGDMAQEIATLLKEKRKLDAIKLLRERTGCGLSEAKEAVEAIERGGGAEVPLPSMSAPAGVEPALASSVLDLARAGKTIEAIKLLREGTGLGLADAKAWVDARAEAR